VEENTFYLTITDTKAADLGKFKAILKNKAGQIETQSALLTITSKN
jgi:hypothetical protein